MKNKIRIYQADDNDALPDVNKFENVIFALLRYFNIDIDKFHEEKTFLGETKTILNYEKAIKFLNKDYFIYKTSTDDLNKNNDNFEDVKKHLKKEIYDIYIIDLRWKNSGNYAGLELIELAKEHVPNKCIFVYSHHHEDVIGLITNGKLNPNEVNLISTKELNLNIKNKLPFAIESARKNIFSNLKPKYIETLHKAIKNDELDKVRFLETRTNLKYNIDSLFVENQYSNIAIKKYIEDVLSVITPSVILDKSSSLMKFMQNNVSEYLNEQRFEIMKHNLDFGAVNLFVRFYFIISKQDFLEKDIYLDNMFRIPKARKASDSNEDKWLRFYTYLVYRRVLILWEKYARYIQNASFNDNLKAKKGNSELLCELLYKMPSQAKKNNDSFKQITKIKLGFFSNNKSINLREENLFPDERLMLRNITQNKIIQYINLIEYINENINSKKYWEKNLSPCKDFWELKSYYFNPVQLEEKLDDYKLDITESINDPEHQIPENFKSIFFNSKITGLTELLK